MTGRCPSGARGQSLVEVALILPMVVLLLVVIFDLGRAVYAQHTIGNAARGGARVAIVNQTETVVEDAARQQAVGLAVDPVFTDCPNTLTDPKLIGCEIRVEVTYQFQPITPIVGAIVGGITLRSTTTMPTERVFPPLP